MSEVTRKAIYEILSEDDILTALLGEDESGNPAIYNASLNKVASPPFPCITFRESSGEADVRFRGQTVDSELYDVEIWAQTESALTVAEIGTEVDRLLHNAVISVDSGECYDSVRTTQSPDLYDDKLKLHFGLYRYRLVVSRS